MRFNRDAHDRGARLGRGFHDPVAVRSRSRLDRDAPARVGVRTGRIGVCSKQCTPRIGVWSKQCTARIGVWSKQCTARSGFGQRSARHGCGLVALTAGSGCACMGRGPRFAWPDRGSVGAVHGPVAVRSRSRLGRDAPAWLCRDVPVRTLGVHPVDKHCTARSGFTRLYCGSGARLGRDVTK